MMRLNFNKKGLKKGAFKGIVFLFSLWLSVFILGFNFLPYEKNRPAEVSGESEVFYKNICFLGRKNQSTLRIGSFNLLADSVGFGGERVKSRKDDAVNLIKSLNLDVLGVQELSSGWFRIFKNDETMGLKFLNGSKTGLFYEMTAILYNPKSLRPVYKGERCFKNYDDKRLRLMAWGIFENKKGDLFGVINTHFNLSLKDNKVAFSQFSEIIDLGKKLNGKFNCPIFLIGDFNIKEGGSKGKANGDITIPIYNAFLSTCLDCKKEAKAKIWGSEKSVYSKSNDHIFLMDSKGIEICKFGLMSQREFVKISDHFLIFVDYILKE